MYDWTDSAPYKVTTVRDALSDLPAIKSGKSDDVMNYGSEPSSHFQKKVNIGLPSFRFARFQAFSIT